MKNKNKSIDTVWSCILAVASILYMYPIAMILFNSFKQERAITTNGAFQLPTAETFAGMENYINAVASKGFLQSLGYSFLITVTSVLAILLFCSMCSWFITRVQGFVSTGLYMLFAFSMVVPFQMVMFTLSQTADMLNLNTPWNIWIIYLGFGAGLAVFMFAGFMKSIPLEVEEASMIDGCISKIERELGKPVSAIVATGSNAKYVLPYCEKNIYLNEKLLLEGLYSIYEKNS